MSKKNRSDYDNQIINSIPAVICEYSVSLGGRLKCLYLSDKCRDILGCDSFDILKDSKHFINMIHKNDKNKIIKAKKEAFFSSEFFTEIRINNPLSGKRWIQISALPYKKADGMTLWRGFIFDITEKKLKEEELKYMITIDSLCGIYNREYFYKKLENEIERFKNTGKKFSLLFIDLDKFKLINDKFGHLMGDEVIKQFVFNVSKLLDSNHVFGRVGGDEFCILFRNCDLDKSKSFALNVREHIEKTPVKTKFGELFITISGGLAEIDQSVMNKLHLIDKADKALLLAKKSGKNSIIVAE